MDRNNQIETIEKLIKTTQSQLTYSLNKIETLEKELKELKLQKDQLRIQQKEIYSNIFNIPNFQYYFPASVTWIFKNLLKISDDFPEDIFPSFLTESDLSYLKEVSQLELQIEAKNYENKINLTRNIVKKTEENTLNLLDSKTKLSEVQTQLKQIKRQSLIIKELDPHRLDLRKMNEIPSEFNENEDNSGTLEDQINNLYNNNLDNDKKTQSDRFLLENTSQDFKKLMFQRSKSKRELKGQVTFLENKRKSQMKLEHFFEEKHLKIQELKKQKVDLLLSECNPQNIDERLLGKLQKRVHALFGIKEGERILEENYDENVNYKQNNQIINHNLMGHDFIEKKMERLNKIKMEEANQEINYRFNPIYNRFPGLVTETNMNKTFLSKKQFF